MDKIRTLCSHQQAIGQCSKFIRSYLKDPEIIFTASTSNACHIIKSIPNSAAIASENVIQIYNIYIAKDIQDSLVNATRFFIISKINNNNNNNNI